MLTRILRLPLLLVAVSTFLAADRLPQASDRDDAEMVVGIRALFVAESGWQSPSATPTPTPCPSPATSPAPDPDAITKIAEIIDRYNGAEDTGNYESTTNFRLEKPTKWPPCKGWMLRWNVIRHRPGATPAEETFQVEVPVVTIEPRSVYATSTLVRFKTSGQTIQVTVPANAASLDRTINAAPVHLSGRELMQRTNSWRIDMRDAAGAKNVAGKLKEFLKSLH